MQMSVHRQRPTTSISEYRVEKMRAPATLTLSNGAVVSGYVFVSEASPTHAGRERIKDVLNAELGFFPFEVVDEAGTRTALFHREHVVLVTLAGNDEQRQDPGLEVATKREVTMLLTSGGRLTGYVRIFRPRGRDRLSDFARSPELFKYLETPDATVIFNTKHVLELMETPE
ncbi:MAG: hypothetical protein ACT4QD_20570 [Acidobacteriota bacterium]